MRDVESIPTDVINEYDYQLALSKYQECNQGIRVCKVSDILTYIQNLELGAMFCYADDDIQKAIKEGEQLMLSKLKYALTSYLSREQVDELYREVCNNAKKN